MLIPVAQAKQLVFERAVALPPVIVAVDDALGLVLAEDIRSDVDSPLHDKSLVDGYAVQVADIERGVRELRVLEEIVAGSLPTQPLSAGTTAAIMTGAPLPRAADAVVMREDTLPGDAQHWVHILTEHVSTGENILRRASVLQQGERLLAAGHCLGPADIGILAEIGHTAPRVVPRPHVAVVVTGNELVPAEEDPAAGQIRNSNGPMLAALVRGVDAVPISLGIARDDRTHLSALIQRGLTADVLLLSGGVSAGVLDLVPRVLGESGVCEVFHKVDMKPGKPLWFGVVHDRTLVFGLPGNPVSSFVGFYVFVRPALERLAGRDITESLWELPLKTDFSYASDRPTYYPAMIEAAKGGTASVVLLPWRGSSDLKAVTCANALALIPAGGHDFRQGDVISGMRLD